jgi:hypothetical protein
VTIAPDFPHLFHTGIVVPDLHAAMHDFTSAFGMTWARPRTSNSDLFCPLGIGQREVMFSYSREGPHHIELVQQINSSAYEAVPGGPRVDHLGFYVRDLEWNASNLVSTGFSLQLAGIGQDGDIANVTFHHNPHGGIYIELLDETVWRDLQPWLTASSDSPTRSP